MWNEIINKIAKNENFRKHLTAKDMRELRGAEPNLRRNYTTNVRNFHRMSSYSRLNDTPNNWQNTVSASSGNRNVGTNKEVAFNRNGRVFSIVIVKKLRSGRIMNMSMSHDAFENTWSKNVRQRFSSNNEPARIIQKARREQVRRRLATFRKSAFARSLPANIRRLIERKT